MHLHAISDASPLQVSRFLLMLETPIFNFKGTSPALLLVFNALGPLALRNPSLFDKFRSDMMERGSVYVRETIQDRDTS